MIRKSVIISAYRRTEEWQTPEQIAAGRKPSLHISLKGEREFREDIDRAYKTVADRGGKVVMEGLVTLSSEPEDFSLYSSWGGSIRNTNNPSPSLLIIAELPEQYEEADQTLPDTSR